MITLITNIQELLQVRETSISKVSGAEMAILPTIKNAFLLIKDNVIEDFGAMENLPEIKADKVIDANRPSCTSNMVRQPYPYCLCGKSRTGICRPN